MSSPQVPDEILGSVVEDDSTVQVLYRTRINSDTHFEGEGRMAVATVRRSAQGWGIWLTWQDHRLFDENSFGFCIVDPADTAQRHAEAREGLCLARGRYAEGTGLSAGGQRRGGSAQDSDY